MARPDKGSSMLKWIGSADDDYLAARQLLLTNSLVKGSSLSNTAIEKYLKAFLIHLDLKIPKGYKGHNIANLYKQIKENGIDLGLNEDYLALLFKAYRLRYPDGLESGFNVALCGIKLLVELDHTVYDVREGIRFEKNGKKVTTEIQRLQERKNPILLDKNCYYGCCDRAVLFNQGSTYYEFRIVGKDIPIEASIYRPIVVDDGKFGVEALKPNSKGGYDLAEWLGEPTK